MGCIVAIFALLAPRVVIVLLAIFSKYLHQAYESALWPILGFLFMPYTTLAYAWAKHTAGGVQGVFWIAVMVIAVLVDLGAHKESDRRRRRQDAA